MTKKPELGLQQSATDFIYEVGGVTRKHSQSITQAFLDDLKDARHDSNKQKAGEFHRIASIPTVIVEKWMREGFDIWKASGPDIVKRLHREDLGLLMATEKRIS